MNSFKNEQEFYAEKGFNAPVRCKPCRDARKAANAAREQKNSPWPESWSR